MTQRTFMIFPGLLSMLIVLLCGSCTPEDHFYKDLAEAATKLYPGKLSSLSIETGNKRARISGLLTVDPSVTQIKVSWNNRADSIVVEVDESEINGYKTIEVPVQSEGYYSFELFTLNNEGVHSIPASVGAYIYGDVYQSGLINRIVLESGFDENLVAYINWATAADLTLQYTVVEYETLSGQTTSVTVPNTTERTTLPGYKTGSSIRYYSVFRPDGTLDDIPANEEQLILE